MERFKSATAARYRPTAALHATLECDAVVRTVSSEHRTLTSLLSAAQRDPPTPTSPPVRLVHNAFLAPCVWLDAAGRLDDTLRSPSASRSPSRLVEAYSAALESVTAVADHDHLSTPLATFLCAWVGEPDVLRSLSAVAVSASAAAPDGTAAALTAVHAVAERAAATPPALPAAPAPHPPHVLLVQRADSRQDEAARDAALAAARAAYGDEFTHVVRLGDTDGDNCPQAVAALIDALVRDVLEAAISDVSRYADKLRKATRSTFRSWFGGTQPTVPTRKPPLGTFSASETELSAMGSPDTNNASRGLNGVDFFEEKVGSGGSGADARANGPMVGRSRKRLSIGSGGVQTPLFPVESIESRTRHLADLYMLAGRYNEALETFRLLQGDLRALAGAALVHEGSASEMSALALALVDGSKQGVGTGIEKAIQMYCKAGRREMAVRATLRGVVFCIEAGFPESAAGVIIRAIDVILPSRPFTLSITAGIPPSSSSFVEAALAVLYTACSGAYTALGKVRRASLYAFLASTRFSKLKFRTAAACIVREVDEKALLRTGVRDDVELIRGLAEMVECRHAQAIGHFVRVMSAADEHTDVEVQGAAIRGFLEATANGAREAMSKRWDTGALFPLVQGNLSRVCTNDSSDGEDPVWKTLEDDVLEDHEFFSILSTTSVDGAVPRRERRVESLITELRKKKELGGSSDPGGSLEMKIKRMREVATSRKKRRRAQSLLERGAIVGEKISIHVSLRNPLQFPVFVDSFAAVVAMDGQCYSLKDRAIHEREEENNSSKCPIDFVPTEAVTLVPCSSQRVTVEVISRRPGVLQFLGLSWSFTIGMGGASAKAKTTAPGFCLLERRGRRLNDNRRQRASDIPLYEKDESLTVTIAPQAPLLRAAVLSWADGTFQTSLESLTLRAGESREARLLLVNEGQVPLKDIVIRIGTPQTVFVDIAPDKVVGGKQNGTIFAIGMDEEFVRPDELTAAARMSVNLAAKQKTEVAVWLRAAVPSTAFGYRNGPAAKKKSTRGTKRIPGGEQGDDGTLPCDVKLAIAYGNEKVRVTRINAQFRVQPSILVSPRFLREADQDVFCNASSNLHGILLGLEVEHGVHSQEENLIFQVTELSVTSRGGWKPMLLPEPSEFFDVVSDEIAQSAASLRINETATVFFLVVREKDYDAQGEGKRQDESEPWRTFSVTLSQGIARERYKVGAPRQEKLKAVDRSECRVEQRASTHFVISSSHSSYSAAAVAKTTRRDLVYVALRWKSSSKVYGEVHIPPIDPLRWMSRDVNPEAMGRESESLGREMPCGDGAIIGNYSEETLGNDLSASLNCDKDDWLVVRVRHPSDISHDFYKKEDRPSYLHEGVVAIPFPAVVGVDVFIKNVCPYLLDVVFAAPTSGGIADGDRGRYWAGDVGMSLRAIPPGAERVLSLTAVLISPGRYNMSKFTVLFQSCGYSTGRVRRHVALEPSYLTVTSRERTELLDRGGVSPLTVIASTALERDAENCDVEPVESTTADVSEAPETDESKSVQSVGLKTGGAFEQRDTIRQDAKRAKSEWVSIATETSDVRLARRQWGSSRNGSPVINGNPRSKSQPPSERRKPFSRARSDTSGMKLFKGSADDALWNASDTDESED